MLVVALMAVGSGYADAQIPDLEEMRSLAYQGDARAQYNLGTMYANGEGVPEDDVEAARLYRLAADQGDAPAQYFLGLMYVLGDGVPQDLVQAYMWLNLAAAQGEDDALEIKSMIEKDMTREQIAEGQRMSREWMARHPPE